MNKIKVGDKVIIRDDLEVENYYNDTKFVGGMIKYLGKEAIITHVYSNNIYSLNIDKEVYNWSEDMFKEIKRNEEFEVGDNVIIRDDLEVGKYYGCAYVCDDMVQYFGKKTTIARVYPGDNTYALVIDGEVFDWTKEMFKKIKRNTSKISKADISKIPEVYELKKRIKILLKAVNDSLVTKSDELIELENKILALNKEKDELSNELDALKEVYKLLDNQLIKII